MGACTHQEITTCFKDGCKHPSYELRSFDGTHFHVIGVMNESQFVKAHHGGRYQFADDTLTLKVDFATVPNHELLNDKLIFKIEFDGDRFKQIAVNSRFNEVWERVPADPIE